MVKVTLREMSRGWKMVRAWILIRPVALFHVRALCGLHDSLVFVATVQLVCKKVDGSKLIFECFDMRVARSPCACMGFL